MLTGPIDIICQIILSFIVLLLFLLRQHCTPIGTLSKSVHIIRKTKFDKYFSFCFENCNPFLYISLIT